MKFYVLLFICFWSQISLSQNEISEVLNDYNDHSIPYISVEEVKESLPKLLLVDSRTIKEYKVSHIKNAIYLNPENPDWKTFTNKVTKKDQALVVYCSIGVRSEAIGKQLKELGYTNVKNLFGGIFDWHNKENPIYDSNGNTTDNIHTYSQQWSKYVTRGKKIYE